MSVRDVVSEVKFVEIGWFVDAMMVDLISWRYVDSMWVLFVTCGVSQLSMCEIPSFSFVQDRFLWSLYDFVLFYIGRRYAWEDAMRNIRFIWKGTSPRIAGVRDIQYVSSIHTIS